jgi:XTP/dITP diphosphohydrolase
MDVYLASGNPHKFKEFAEMVHHDRIPVSLKMPPEPGGMPDVEETGTTFEENARIKADALAAMLSPDAWVLADDSGLQVDALDGAPGVHSARYAGPGGNTEANNIKLIQALLGVPMPERTARFVCVLYFTKRGGEGHFFRGTCEGHILEAPSGRGGFGYDPLFLPTGYDKSFAELGNKVKNCLSHRGRAVGEWAKFIRPMRG